jgi:hypothetical protein
VIATRKADSIRYHLQINWTQSPEVILINLAEDWRLFALSPFSGGITLHPEYGVLPFDTRRQDQ